MIFKNITDLINVVGASASASLQIQDIDPDFNYAMEEYIHPLISKATAGYILTASHPAYAGSKAALYKAVAYLGLYEFAQHSSVHMSGNGMMRLEGEGVRSSYRYQEDAYREYCLRVGWNAVDKMLIAMAEIKFNMVEDALWTQQLEASTHSRMIWNAAQMRQLYNTQVDRSVFEIMRPVVHDIEDYIIRPILTDAVYDNAISALSNAYNKPVPAKMPKMISLAQKAIVHILVRECVLRNWVRIDHKGIVAVSTTDEQANYITTPASAIQLNVITKTHQDWAVKVIGPLKKYLTDNAGDLGYVEPTDPAEDEDEDTCCDRCAAPTFCPPKKGNTVIGL